MRSMNERLVLVPASVLADVIEMLGFAADEISDPRLKDAIRGAAAAVRVEATFEP